MNNKFDYKTYAESKSPKSKTVKNCVMAFLFGGAICTIAELIADLLRFIGVSEERVAVLLPVVMIFIGVALTALGVYEKLGSLGGAGTIVPITGFANSIAAPAMEFKQEGFVLGVGAKIFTVAGPVLLYGTVISAVGGIIYYFIK